MEKSRLILILLLAVPLLTLGRVASHEFLFWDDKGTIYQNPKVYPPSLEKVALNWKEQHSGLYIPVTYTVWVGLASIAQLDEPDEVFNRLNPWIFHAASLIVHLLSVLVVYQILLLLLNHEWAACIAALVFAIHPVQVEPVAWASGLKDVLCGLFALVATWQYLLYARQAKRVEDTQRQSKKRKDGSPSFLQSKHFWLGTVALVLGMLSKPTAMVTPALVAVLDRLLIGRSWRQILPPTGLWLMLAVPFMIIARLVQEIPQMMRTEVWQRPFIAADALAFYLFKLIWPSPLSVDYGRKPDVIFENGWAWWTWIVPVVVTLVTLFLLWRRKTAVPLASWLVLIVGVAPVLGLTTFLFQFYSTVADHYLYIAMLGVALFVGWAAMRLWSRPTAIVCGILIAVLAGRSFVQAGVWKYNERFFQHVLDVNPRSIPGWNNMGVTYDMQGKWEVAKDYYLKAIELWPDDPGAYENMAYIFWRQRNVDEGLRYIKMAIERWENLPPDLRMPVDESLFYLGMILLELDRPHEAVDFFERALRENPRRQDAAQMLVEARRVANTRPATTAPAAAPTTVPATGPTGPDAG